MRKSLLTWCWALGAVAAALGASCSSEEGGKAATGGTGGGSGGSEAGSCGPTPLDFPGECKPGAPAECCATELPVMVVRGPNDTMLTPDWSCLTGATDAGTGGGGGADASTGGAGGTAGSAGSAGSGGAAGSAGSAGSAGAGGSGGASTQNVFEVEDFSSSKPVVDIEVELFEGESIVGKTPFHTAFTKGPANPSDPALNNGQFYFPHPASEFLSYRVKEKPGVAKEFIGFGYPVPKPPGKVTGATLSPDLYSQLATFVVPIPGWKPPEDLAIITGPIRDCAGKDVGGARVRFFDEVTNEEVVPGSCDRDVRYVYFDAQLPNPKCSFTDRRQALFVIANAPGNVSGADANKKLRVEYWGRIDASSAAPVKFAQKSIEIFPGTVNVQQIRPNVPQP